MGKKFNFLKSKVFNNFVSGLYGVPRIPTDSEVYSVLKTITKDDSEPLITKEQLKTLDFTSAFTNFQHAIDDISIIINDTNRQSLSIYNQLTDSLKEYNGIKRDLRLVKFKADDILAMKSGKDYIRCVFTETFNSVDNINTYLSSTNILNGSPIIDIQSGFVSIPTNSFAILDLSHYFDKKLDISHVNYTGTIISAGYVGISNAGVMLNTSDPNRLVYKLQLDRPSYVVTAFTLQLSRDRSPKKINSIIVDLDSSMAFNLKIYHKTENGWEIIPTLPDINITTNINTLQFESISTTHLKFEMIKEQPDVLESNEYYYIFNNIVISEDTPVKSGFIYSKPISFSSLLDDAIAIDNVAIDINAFVPSDASIRAYVAKDILIPGWFTDEYGNIVDPTSSNASNFEIDSEYNPDNLYKYVYLSDIKNNLDVSGTEDYFNADFNWVAVGSFDEKNGMNPKVVTFNDLFRKPQFDNSLFNSNPIRFGDRAYFPTLGVDGVDNWITSGPVGTQPWHDVLDGENLLYDEGPISDIFDTATHTITLYDPKTLEPISPSVDNFTINLKTLETDLYGYPFGYVDPATGQTITFGYSFNVNSGWWRPYSSSVVPINLDINEDLVGDVFPDFSFNGIKFYKIFKFNDIVIPSSIRIFNYPSTPVSNSGDYYPHSMKWNYRKKYVVNTFNYTFPTISQGPDAINLSNIVISEKNIVKGSIKNVRYLNDTIMFSENIHFDTNYGIKQSPTSDEVTVIDFSKLQNTSYFKENSNLYFEYTVSTPSTSDSHWSGYLLVESECELQIIRKISTILVNNVVITDSNGTIIYSSPSTLTDNDTTETIKISIAGTYSIKIYIAVEDGSIPDWLPYNTDNLIISNNVKLVSTITPLKIVDFDVLLYSTQYENDTRAAIIREWDGSQFLVIKEPAKDIVPGYFYDSINSEYVTKPEYLIKNNNHYYREQVRIELSESDPNTTVTNLYKYVTGSKGDHVYTYTESDPTISDSGIDTDWNGGVLYPVGMKNIVNNTESTEFFDNISTYGHDIHLGDINDIKGNLFYNTAENLPAFYTIEYSTSKNVLTTNKLLYKLELSCENRSPIVDAIKITANVLGEEYAK